MTRVSVAHQRGLNQAILLASRIPAKYIMPPGQFVRALRSALRMTQAQLAQRSRLPRAHITRIEGGRVDAQISSLRRLFDVMFCDLLILPRARQKPTDALAERRIEKRRRNPWG